MTTPDKTNDELLRAQQEFIARGLASRDAAKQSGEYISSNEVLAKLDAILAARHQREDDYH